nr:uncharacterized protein LOC118967927 [Manis javanica]
MEVGIASTQIMAFPDRGNQLLGEVTDSRDGSFQISRQQFALCPPFSGGYKKTCCLSDSSGDDFQALRVGTETVNLEPSMFPVQRGSLSLLRQKWESGDHQKVGCCPGGSHCRLFQPQKSRLLEPGEAVSAPGPPGPPSQPCSAGAMLNSEPEEMSPEHKGENPREHGRPEVLKEDPLRGPRRIERFSIALDKLRSVFEAPRSGNSPAGPAEYGRKVRSH